MQFRLPRIAGLTTPKDDDRHQSDAVFIWIPKNAGTSLFVALEAALGLQKYLKSAETIRQFPNHGFVTFGHVHYLSLRAQGIVGDAFHARAYRFAICRDPYDRAYSLYNYLIRHKTISGSFIGFLADLDRSCPPIGLYNAIGTSQANPQVDWLLDADGRFVVQDLFRHEDLPGLVSALSARFQLTGLVLPRKNQSPRAMPLDEALASHDEIVPIINQFYRRDFLLLGYPKR